MSIAKVIVNLSLDRSFDYRVPAALTGVVKPGVQVNVPFGNSTRRGFVVGLADSTDYPNVKAIKGIAEEHPAVPEPLMELGQWMGEYYCCSQEQAVRTLLPGVVRSGRIRHKTLSYFFIDNLPKVEEYLIEHAKRSKAKAKLLKALMEHMKPVPLEQLLAETGVGRSVLKELKDLELVAVEERVVSGDPYADVEILPTTPLEPNVEQKSALSLINGVIDTPAKQHVILLYGITGSGKTEVYLQAINHALEQGKEAIVLVPEISLTPQTVRRFRSRFGDQVSVMHSGLTERERFDEWNKVYRGEVSIVVGARSALFAPFKRLGLIVVDEEHENSYKQSEAPRYHARDVAVMRGMLEGAAVVLGSATPSFESYNNAREGRYHLAELKERADDCVLPGMQVVDIRKEVGGEGEIRFFSKSLVNAVRQRLADCEQTILFLNRRGYARQMLCEHCGYTAECPDCSIAYTYHRKRQTLTCHLCGSVIAAHVTCPDCKAEDIRYSGLGTEKLEDHALKLFQGARIARMDSDTMTNRHAYEQVLDEFQRGNIDILIGTQMIAKGLHFPKVTLVGIINADHSLAIPDFRAGERTFQLLTQVAGRAGRGEIKGDVIIQTFSPFNETIQFAMNHDYLGFYKYDMEFREQLFYPPAGHLIAVHFRSEDVNLVEEFAWHFYEQLKPYLHDEIRVSEPMPAPIERIKKKYRYLIMFRGKKLKRFRQALRYLALHVQRPKQVDVYVDVDALSLM